MIPNYQNVKWGYDTRSWNNTNVRDYYIVCCVGGPLPFLALAFGLHLGHFCREAHESPQHPLLLSRLPHLACLRNLFQRWHCPKLGYYLPNKEQSLLKCKPCFLSLQNSDPMRHTKRWKLPEFHKKSRTLPFSRLAATIPRQFQELSAIIKSERNEAMWLSTTSWMSVLRTEWLTPVTRDRDFTPPFSNIRSRDLNLTRLFSQSTIPWLHMSFSNIRFRDLTLNLRSIYFWVSYIMTQARVAQSVEQSLTVRGLSGIDPWRLGRDFSVT